MEEFTKKMKEDVAIVAQGTEKLIDEFRNKYPGVDIIIELRESNEPNNKGGITIHGGYFFYAKITA